MPGGAAGPMNARACPTISAGPSGRQQAIVAADDRSGENPAWAMRSQTEGIQQTTASTKRQARQVREERARARSLPGLREERYSQSLARGLAILGCFTPARPTLGIADVADELDMTRSTTHRYSSP